MHLTRSLTEPSWPPTGRAALFFFADRFVRFSLPARVFFMRCWGLMDGSPYSFVLCFYC